MPAEAEFLAPLAISAAQGRCKVMAYTGSPLEGPVTFHGGYSPRRGRHRSGAGPNLGDHAGGHGGPDDAVAAVVLAGDALECQETLGHMASDRPTFR